MRNAPDSENSILIEGTIRQVIVLDDEISIARAIEQIVDLRCRIAYFSEIETFLNFLLSDECDDLHSVAFIDISLSEGDEAGFDALDRLRAHGIDVPVVFLSHSQLNSHIRRAAGGGAVAFVDKLRLSADQREFWKAIDLAIGSRTWSTRAREAGLTQWGIRTAIVVASLRHELGQLIGPMMTTGIALTQGVRPERVAELGKLIVASANDAQEWLQKTLAFIENQNAVIAVEQFDIVDTVRKLARENPHGSTEEIVVSSPEDSLYIKADPLFVNHAISNLLSNAVKYGSSEHGIVISLCSDSENVSISVRDFGHVVLNKFQRRLIWSPFVRLDDAGSKEGSGIGLALVRLFAEMHGGVAVHELPADGRGGNKFTIILPVNGPRPSG